MVEKLKIKIKKENKLRNAFNHTMIRIYELLSRCPPMNPNANTRFWEQDDDALHPNDSRMNTPRPDTQELFWKMSLMYPRWIYNMTPKASPWLRCFASWHFKMKFHKSLYFLMSKTNIFCRISFYPQVPVSECHGPFSSPYSFSLSLSLSNWWHYIIIF